jgi:hypothetical protein
MCSLNWADILAGYCRGRARIWRNVARTDVVSLQQRAARSCSRRPVCRCPILNTCPDVGTDRGPGPGVGVSRHPPSARLCANGETLVLIGLGGVDMRPPLDAWPTQPGVRWLVPAQLVRSRGRTWWIGEQLDGCSMVDLIRSCDVLAHQARLRRIHRSGLQRRAARSTSRATIGRRSLGSAGG